MVFKYTSYLELQEIKQLNWLKANKIFLEHNKSFTNSLFFYLA